MRSNRLPTARCGAGTAWDHPERSGDLTGENRGKIRKDRPRPRRGRSPVFPVADEPGVGRLDPLIGGWNTWIVVGSGALFPAFSGVRRTSRPKKRGKIALAGEKPHFSWMFSGQSSNTIGRSLGANP
jgi:hypothetical protein